MKQRFQGVVTGSYRDMLFVTTEEGDARMAKSVYGGNPAVRMGKLLRVRLQLVFLQITINSSCYSASFALHFSTRFSVCGFLVSLLSLNFY